MSSDAGAPAGAKAPAAATIAAAATWPDFSDGNLGPDSKDDNLGGLTEHEMSTLLMMKCQSVPVYKKGVIKSPNYKSSKLSMVGIDS